jgi:glycerophosphoryl diester phosphodiesterase
MAVITTTLTCELQEAVKVQYLNGNIFSQDNQANVIKVNVLNNGSPATLTGSISANITRQDGGTVAATGGSISGNVASITLPAAAYAVPGGVSIVIKNTNSSVVTTIAAIVANVYQSSTDTVVDPGTIIPSVQTLISAIETAVASIPADYSSLWTSLAPAFSSSASYVAGQYVTYDGGLYRFTTTHSGSWSSSDAVSVNIGGDLSDLKSALLTVDENTNAILFRSTGYASNPRPCIINATTNKYTATAGTYHIIIPINSGDEIKIKGQSTYTGRIAFLTNIDVPKAGDTPSYSTVTGFTELIAVTVNTSYTYTVPSDAKYLYVAHTSSNHSLLPVVLTINGINVFQSIYKELHDYSDELNNRIGLWIIQKGSYQSNSATPPVYMWDGTTGYCAFVKVKPGSEYTIKAAASEAQYRGLKAVSLPVLIGDSANISESEGWTEQRTISPNATANGVIPSDVNYLCFYIGVNTTYPKMPVILSINGADYRKSIMENIGDNSGITGKLNNELNKGLKEKAIYKGRNNEGVWDDTSGYTAIIEVNPGDSYCIEADLDVNCPYYGVKSTEMPPKNGDTTDFSDAEGWDEVRYVGLTSNSPKIVTGTVPSDVHYLCFYAGTTTSYTRLPKAITINEINVMKSLVDNVRETRSWANDTLDFNETVYNDEEVWTVGHGGYAATYPFNSAMAFRDAARHGFKGIETDVQFTSDNVPVLCHDDGLYTYARNPDGTRVGTSKEDTVFIHDITYEQLLYYDFGLARGLPAGMKITTFEQMVQITKRLGLRVIIELKRYLTPSNAQIDILFDILDKYGMRRNVIFHSAVFSAIQYVHEKDPMMPIGYIVGDSITQTEVNQLRSLKDRNKAYINGNCSISSAEEAMIKEAGLLYYAGLPETQSDILNATPFISIFVSNDLIAEDVMRNYELGQLPD